MSDISKIILIVEDEAPLLNGLGDKFSREGFTVLKATDGKEGLDCALAKHPDFVLLDKYMPNMNGLEMLQRLRQDAWGKSVPVMMWSNSHGDKTIAEAQSYGIVDFIVKSDWEFKDIVQKVKDIIGIK